MRSLFWNPSPYAPQNHVPAADFPLVSTLTLKCTTLTPRVPVPSLSLIVHSPHFVLLIRIGLWAGAAILWRQLEAMHPTPTVSLVSIIWAMTNQEHAVS
jgi:hypothetical protein